MYIENLFFFLNLVFFLFCLISIFPNTEMFEKINFCSGHLQKVPYIKFDFEIIKTLRLLLGTI